MSLHCQVCAGERVTTVYFILDPEGTDAVPPGGRYWDSRLSANQIPTADEFLKSWEARQH